MEDPKTVTLDPLGGFVVKSRILEGNSTHSISTKVFINVCHDAQVPKPPGEFIPEEVFPKIVKNEWEIPLIVLPEKRDRDKKGIPSLVYDCCINTECFHWVQLNNDLKLILIEWCIESVELMYSIVLDRAYSTPKMLSKGELSKTEVSEEELQGGLQKKLQELKQNEVLGLLEELEPEKIEETELPDLMNIDGKKAKPLIEELDTMSLEPKDTKRVLKTKSKPKKIQTISNEPRVVPMEVEVSSRKLPNGEFLLQLRSPQLTESIETEYRGGTFTLTNKDPATKLGQSNKLELPFPPGFDPYRIFLCKQDTTLYVFAKAG